MGYQFGGAPAQSAARAPGELVLMTYNRGQEGDTKLDEFKKAVAPDLIALQDGWGGKYYYRNKAAYHDLPNRESTGEFTLLSKFPIKEGKLVYTPKGVTAAGPRAIAARFVIDFNGAEVAVYNFHLPTPRRTLNGYRRGRFLYGIIGIPGTEWGRRREMSQNVWDERIAIGEFIRQTLRDEPLPFLAAGDFNTPDRGYLYRLISGDLGDAHRAGSGCGFTFPGDSLNPLAGFEPWLRIDYVFAGKGWEAVGSTTEEARGSQHRATAGRLRMK
ncbi:MAG: endonuclease/exonuclease/phosphatase family protein [Verrucomicrobiales bacterium]